MAHTIESLLQETEVLIEESQLQKAFTRLHWARLLAHQKNVPLPQDFFQKEELLRKAFEIQKLTNDDPDAAEEFLKTLNQTEILTEYVQEREATKDDLL